MKKLLTFAAAAALTCCFATGVAAEDVVTGGQFVKNHHYPNETVKDNPEYNVYLGDSFTWDCDCWRFNYINLFSIDLPYGEGNPDAVEVSYSVNADGTLHLEGTAKELGSCKLFFMASGNEEPYNECAPHSLWINVEEKSEEKPAEESSSSSSSSSSAPAAPITDGSYKIPAAKIGSTLTPKNFAAATINPVTNDIAGVYDNNGNLIKATLSSDGHWYLIPTADGIKMLPAFNAAPAKAAVSASAPVSAQAAAAVAAQEKANAAYENAIAAYQAQIAAEQAAYLASLH